jgi:hypothetical protein
MCLGAQFDNQEWSKLISNAQNKCATSSGPIDHNHIHNVDTLTIEIAVSHTK